MAEKFSLVAQIQLQAPTNTRQVVDRIRRDLSGVSVQIHAKGAAKTANEVGKVSKQLKNASKSATTFATNLKIATQRAAGLALATRAVSALTTRIKSAVDESIAFQRELVKVSQVTGKTLNQLKGLAKEVTNLSTSLGVSSSALIGVSRQLSQAGFQAADLQIALSSLAKTALAPTFDDITRTAEGAIAIFNQFGKGAAALEGQLGAINAVAGQFAVESGDLIGVVQRVGGVFKSAGGNLNELLALFTSVRATTRESSESIATGLRTIFTRIQRPRTIAFLKSLGVELTDAQGRFIGPIKAVEALNKAFADLPQGDLRFIRIAEELGGFRQIGKVIPLIQQFAVAQEALKTAQGGQDSLAKDAATAQQSLAVQIEKVRQEYLALIREFTDSSSFKLIVGLALNFASALAKVLSSLKDVLPLLAIFGASRLVAGVAGGGLGGLFGGRGAAKKNQGGPIGFARGGVVPGTGNRDTVPAMLTPGEFVIKKSSVGKIGAGTLASMNGYAGGGQIKDQKKLGMAVADDIKDKPGDVSIDLFTKGSEGSVLRKKTGFGPLNSKTIEQLKAISGSGSARKKDLEEGKIPLNDLKKIAGSHSFKGKKKFGTLAAGLGDTKKDFDSTVNNEYKDFLKNASANFAPSIGITNFDKEKVSFDKDFKINQGELGTIFENLIDVFDGRPLIEQAKETRRPFDFTSGIKFGKAFSTLKGINFIDAKVSGGKNIASAEFERKATNQLADDLINNQGFLSAIGVKNKELIAEGRQQPDKKGVTSTSGVKRTTKASGGGISGSDTVPALLTPGEFVINKKAASRIGSSSLNTMNKKGVVGFNKGGMVGFNKGGGVLGGGGAGFAALALASGGLQTMFGQMGEEGSALNDGFNALTGAVTSGFIQFQIMNSIIAQSTQRTKENAEAKAKEKQASDKLSKSIDKRKPGLDRKTHATTRVQQTAEAKEIANANLVKKERAAPRLKRAAQRDTAAFHATTEKREGLRDTGSILGISKFQSDKEGLAEARTSRATARTTKQEKDVEHEAAKEQAGRKDLGGDASMKARENLEKTERKAAAATEQYHKSLVKVGKAKSNLKQSTKELTTAHEAQKKAYRKAATSTNLSRKAQEKLTASRVKAKRATAKAIAAEKQLAMSRKGGGGRGGGGGMGKAMGFATKAMPAFAAALGVATQAAGYFAEQANKRLQGSIEEGDVEGIRANAQSAQNAETAGSMLSGAGQGAMLGAAIGSVVPVIGTAVGGFVGALAGAATAFFFAEDAAKKTAEAMGQLSQNQLAKATRQLQDFSEGLSGSKGISEFANSFGSTLKESEKSFLASDASTEEKQARTKQNNQLRAQAAGEIAQETFAQGGDLNDVATHLQKITDSSGKLTEAQIKAAESAFKVAAAQAELIKVNLDAARIGGATARAGTAVDNILATFETGSSALQAAFNTLETSTTTFGGADAGKAALGAISQNINAQLDSLGINRGSAGRQAVDRSVASSGAALDFSAQLSEQLSDPEITRGEDPKAAIEGIVTKITSSINDPKVTAIVQGSLKQVIEGATDNGQIDGSKVVEGLTQAANKAGVPLKLLGEALIKQQKVINKITNERRAQEQKLMAAQSKAIDLQLEGARVIEQAGGPKLNMQDRLGARATQASLQLRDAGVSGLAGTDTSSVRAASRNIANRSAELNQTRGLQNRDDDRRPELKKANDGLIQFTRQRIKLIQEEMSIVKQKNALERSAIDALLSGDAEAFFKNQSASAAASALKSGNTALIRSLDASSVGAGLKSLQDQGTSSTELFSAARTAGLSQQQAKVFSGTTEEETSLRRELADNGRTLGDLGNTGAELEAQGIQPILDKFAEVQDAFQKQLIDGLKDNSADIAASQRELQQSNTDLKASLDELNKTVAGKNEKVEVTVNGNSAGGVGGKPSQEQIIAGIKYALGVGGPLELKHNQAGNHTFGANA